MNKLKGFFKNATVLIGLSGVLLIAVVLMFWNWSVDNKVVSLTERFSAQVDVSKTAHDEMWKVIKQEADVSDKYFQDFEKIFTSLIDGRYAKDGNMLMKWIQEHNPTYSPELYKELMTTIKTERAKFKRAQDICIDVKREFFTYINKSPTKFFVNDDVLAANAYKGKTKDELATLYKSGEFQSETTYTVVQMLNYQPVLSTKTNDVFEKGVDDDVNLFEKK